MTLSVLRTPLVAASLLMLAACAGTPASTTREPDERGATESAWRDDLRLLRAEHRALRHVVDALRSADLSKQSPRKSWTVADTVAGVASHDVYHAGQIQVLRRLYLKR